MANDFLVRVGADLSAFISEMEKIGVEVDKAVKDAEKSFAGFERLGDKLTGIGTALTVGITAPLGLMAGAAISAAGDFGAAMNKVKANLDDVSASGIAQLDALAKKLGADTKFSALEAAQGMGEFAAAGRTTSEILSVMRPALDLAAAAQTNVAQASQITNDILGQFGLKAGDAKGVIDLLAKAGTESSGSLLEMANSLSYVGPIAAKSGVDVGQTAAALVELDKAGVRGEKAGTALRAMLLALADPSKEAQRTINALGISTKDASGNFLPFPQILDNFKAGLEKAGGSAQQLGAVSRIFGRETATAASILINQGGPALTAYEEKLKNSEGAARKMADTLNSGMKGAFEQLRGSVETVAISFGQVLEPIVVRGANLLQGFVDNVIAPAVKWFGELPAPIQYTALGLAALAAAAGPVILGAGLLISGFASVGSSLAVINAALLPAAAAFSAFAATAIAPVVAAIAGFVTTTIPAFVLGVGEMVMAIGMQATAALIQFSSTQVPQLVASLASAAAGFVTLAATIVTEAITALSTFALTSIPAAAAAVVAFVTTTIPAAVSAFASFAVAGVGAVASALGALATVSLPYIVGAVAIAAAAFGAWKLAEWALTTEPVKKAIAAIGDVINWLIDQIKKIPGVTAIIETLKGASEKVGTAFEGAKEQGKKLWDTMNGTGAAAAKLPPHFDNTGNAAKRAAEQQRELEGALSAFSLASDGANSKTERLWQQLRILEQAAKDGRIPMETLEAATKKLHDEAAKADFAAYQQKLKLVGLDAGGPGGVAEKLTAAQSALDLVKKEVDLGLRPLSDYQIALTNAKAAADLLYPPIYTLKDAFAAMTAEVNLAKPALDLLGTTASATRDYMAGVAMSTNDAALAAVNAAAPTAALEVAYKNLGITSTAALQDKARIATEAYTAIATSGTASARDIAAAYEAMRKAQSDANPNYVKGHTDAFDSILKKGVSVFSGAGSIHEKWDTFAKDATKWTGDLAKTAIEKLFVGKGSWAELGVTGIGSVQSSWGTFAKTLTEGVGPLATSIGEKLFTGKGSWAEIGKQALLDLGSAFGTMAAKWIGEATGLASELSGIFSSIKVPTINIPGIGGGSSGGGASVPSTGGGDIAGAVAGAVGSSLSGIVGAVGSVATAISSVVSNFQMAGMNKSLDVIVQHTLGTKNELENLRRDEWTREGHNMAKWDDIWNAILGINSWDAPVIHKLDSIWDTLLNGGVSTGGGGGVGTAALQSIEASSIGTNDHLAAFRTEVSTGFYNIAVQGDGVINELRAIAGNTKPTPAGALSVVAPNLEAGLRNINLTGQGIYNALSPLKDIRDTLGAMRNNIGVVNGIKEALIGQLGLMYKSLEETSGSLLREIARNTYPVYQVYDRMWKSINTASASAGGGSAAVAGARPISIQVTVQGAMVTTEIAEDIANIFVARLRNVLAT